MPARFVTSAVSVRGLGRAFDVFAADRDRTRHVLWSALGHLPGLRSAAVPRAEALRRRVWALRDVTFDVPRGASLGIVGANGAGKSTLLHLLCGTLAPTTGAVSVAGRIGALLELGAGFVPDLTGRENVRLSGLLHGLDEATITARMDAIAAFADIGSSLDQPVRTYSTGMYLRLAFAVMAHVDADVLIVDEALAVGDIRFVQKCLAHLDAFRAAGGTLLFVSHDLAAVRRLCDRALWIDRGQLRMDGPPREVTEAYFDAMIGATPSAPSPSTTPEVMPPESGVAEQTEARARLVDVQLLDEHDTPVRGVSGGEPVRLEVTAESGVPLRSPVIGFYVKDRLGQPLFGENTLALGDASPVAAGTRFGATFRFVMPRLFPGDYLVAVAIADGTQATHAHHEWRHDAWQFTSTWPGSATGLVGIDVEVRWVSAARDRASCSA